MDIAGTKARPSLTKRCEPLSLLVPRASSWALYPQRNLISHAWRNLPVRRRKRRARRRMHRHLQGGEVLLLPLAWRNLCADARPRVCCAAGGEWRPLLSIRALPTPAHSQQHHRLTPHTPARSQKDGRCTQGTKFVGVCTDKRQGVCGVRPPTEVMPAVVSPCQGSA